MEIDLVLEQVIMVLVLVAEEQTDASIKPRQSILWRVVSEAMTDSVDKAIQVRHPILSQQILINKMIFWGGFFDRLLDVYIFSQIWLQVSGQVISPAVQPTSAPPFQMPEVSLIFLSRAPGLFPVEKRIIL